VKNFGQIQMIRVCSRHLLNRLGFKLNRMGSSHWLLIWL